MNSFDDLFSAVKDYCAERVTSVSFDLFFKDLQAVRFEANTAVLLARNAFLKGMLEEKYTLLLQEAFKACLGFEVQVELVAPEEEEKPQQAEEKPGPESNVYTFDNFVVGSMNKFAYAAAQAVAANPSGAYNPLFIWGGSGLGKTHLLNAIQYEIKKAHPDFKIVYVSAETFTNEIIAAIQEKTTMDFHNKYRQADVLLVDDVHSIAGKESTQEEFFNTFNTLHIANKQIVLTSDRPPKEIKSLEDRLRTRFEMGLTADIQPPDFETRVAIIRRKADSLGLDISSEVTEYIANRLKENVRQLEGTVKKLKAYHILEGIQPSIGAAQNAIKDILSETQPLPVTIDKVIDEVARSMGVEKEEICGRGRSAKIAKARHVCMYILREVTDMSTEEIGERFGGRDHSTVVYAIKSQKDDMEKDPVLRELVEDICKNVRA